jgi:hypothetical protein
LKNFLNIFLEKIAIKSKKGGGLENCYVFLGGGVVILFHFVT